MAAIRQGPVPQHVAFVMDGNRRFAKNHKIEVVEGHNLGFEALAKVHFVPCSSCILMADNSADPRSMLQDWRQMCYHIRLQH